MIGLQGRFLTGCEERLKSNPTLMSQIDIAFQIWVKYLNQRLECRHFT